MNIRAVAKIKRLRSRYLFRVMLDLLWSENNYKDSWSKDHREIIISSNNIELEFAILIDKRFLLCIGFVIKASIIMC
jgi:hypothetical protein